MFRPARLSASVRDLREKKDLGRRAGSFSADVPAHGVVMVKVEPGDERKVKP